MSSAFDQVRRQRIEDGFGGGAMTGHVFGATDIDNQVLVADGLPDHLPRVYFFSGTDKEGPALLQMLQGIAAGRAQFVRDQRAVLLDVDGPGYGLVGVEEGVEGARAAGGV